MVELSEFFDISSDFGLFSSLIGYNGTEIDPGSSSFLNCSLNSNGSGGYDVDVDVESVTASPFCNNSGSVEDEGDGAPVNSLWIRLMVLILYGIVCMVGLCGNTLVIYVVIRFSKMQTVTNLYIVNLAIADECFLVGIPFLMSTTALEYWPFGNIMCKIYFTTTSINQVTSSMFLLIMSADRFLAVCHPISATKWRTPLIATSVSITAWALSAFIMVPIFMYAKTKEIIRDRANCNIFWPDGWIRGDATFMMYSFVLGFAIPLILISIFYFLVIIRLRHVGPKRPKNLNPPSVSVTSATAATTGKSSGASSELNHMPTPLTANQYSRARDRKKSKRKVTKLVLTVITVYFLCWAPYWISQLALISMEHETYHSQALLTIFLLAGCLSYSNSAMNPILYAFLSDNFKKSFVKACSCANRKDALTIDNSMYPRNRGTSLKSERRGTGDSGSLPNPLLARERSSSVNPSGKYLPGIGGGNNATGATGTNYFNKPIIKIAKDPIDEEEGPFLDEEDEEGSGTHVGGNRRLSVPSLSPSPRHRGHGHGQTTMMKMHSTGPAIISQITEDGVHVTAL